MYIFSIMEINILPGALTDIAAKKEPLVKTNRAFDSPTRWCCVTIHGVSIIQGI